MTVHRIDGHKLLNFASHIDDNAVEQAKQTAAMPFVHPHVALMPDVHSGKGSAVGTVIPTIDAVIPAAVGVDIGCGMIAARMTFTAGDLAGRDMSALRKAIESAIPLSPGNYSWAVATTSSSCASTRLKGYGCSCIPAPVGSGTRSP